MGHHNTGSLIHDGPVVSAMLRRTLNPGGHHSAI
eukprot:CAMPEP_0174309312 /NCGR_PEP_ID=MMETSP0810-20121108/2325_1 /TAXON_ID=73025 ORGANISM="Eutreptiella gymnastica-like, Strain CCMP1594" /NCGR_SAMPLE_ID=MMETSP0810 /ASSEMBLY_ACC=CAM_ASM_000659 /LENGTH=33 /DNA_ID= /DNA_START= /DNA_END= /DNA_ORIENTATION=